MSARTTAVRERKRRRDHQPADLDEAPGARELFEVDAGVELDAGGARQLEAGVVGQAHDAGRLAAAAGEKPARR
jgi:hypothetical protein